MGATVVLTVVISLLAAPVAAGTPAVTAAGGTTSPGETVTVDVDVTNAQTVKLSNVPTDWSVVGSADAEGTFNDQVASEGLVGWVWLSGDQSSKTVSVTFRVPDDEPTGDRSLDATVEDSDGNTDTGTATVTVESSTPVTADAGLGQNVDAGSSVQLDGTGSSGDGSLTYSWMQTAGPGVSLTDADTATPTFTAPDVSSETTLAFELTVTDGAGGSDADTVQVTVAPDTPDYTASVRFEDQTAESGTVSCCGKAFATR